MQCEPIESKTIPEETIVFALAVLDVTNEGVRDVFEVSPNLMQPTRFGPSGHP